MATLHLIFVSQTGLGCSVQRRVEVLTEGVRLWFVPAEVTFQIVLVDGCIWRCITLPLNLVSRNDEVEHYVYVVFHIVLV